MIQQEKAFTVLNPNAAGIDISSKEHFVAIDPVKSKTPIRSFGSFTEDLEELCCWLKGNTVDTVAMEATGIYWVSLFLLLQEKGFDVILVNAKHLKNVRGKKTDVQDAEWIRQLHSCGLLRGSFQPDLQTRELRCYLRHRSNLIGTSADSIRLMQKAFEQMNIKLHNVISDITGKTGRLIIEAILQGERNPETLASFGDKRIRQTKKPDMVKSLTGIWKEEHIFELKQAYSTFNFNQQLIEECDAEIDKLLRKMANTNRDSSKINRSTKTNKNNLNYEVKDTLEDLLGTDLSEIYGLSPTTITEIISEVGVDMSKWATSKHFTSWLNLCPNNKISGGKILKSKRDRKKNKASQVFKLAANSVIRSKHWLSAFYHKIKLRRGAGKAIVATARKIAIIFYEMISRKEAFKPLDVERYNNLAIERRVKALEKNAKSLGYSLQML